MSNRRYADLDELRRDAVELIRRGRYNLTRHAQGTHLEISNEEKILAVLAGHGDQPNQSRPTRPSYVCWYLHPEHGLLRAVYAIIEGETGARVRIITVFRE